MGTLLLLLKVLMVSSMVCNWFGGMELGWHDSGVIISATVLWSLFWEKDGAPKKGVYVSVLFSQNGNVERGQ